MSITTYFTSLGFTERHLVDTAARHSQNWLQAPLILYNTKNVLHKRKHSCKITVQILPRYYVVTTVNLMLLINTAATMSVPPCVKKHVHLQIYSHLAALTWFSFHVPL